MTSIRLARSADVSKLVEIDAELYGSDGYPHFSIKQYLDLFRASFFVAEDKGQLVGYCIVGVEAFSSEGWLLSIVVRKRAQHKGVGRALMDVAGNYCESSPIERCSLTVHPDNIAAVSLYKQFGFTVEEIFPDYYETGDPRMFMSKSYAAK